MTCYHPLKCYYPLQEDQDGKRHLIFNPEVVRNYNREKLPFLIDNDGFIDYTEMYVPCGNCIGCRLDYSRSWAIRSVHERY